MKGVTVGLHHAITVALLDAVLVLYALTVDHVNAVAIITVAVTAAATRKLLLFKFLAFDEFAIVLLNQFHDVALVPKVDGIKVGSQKLLRRGGPVAERILQTARVESILHKGRLIERIFGRRGRRNAQKGIDAKEVARMGIVGRVRQRA